MRTRYQVDGRIVHFEVDNGSESIIIELSRASLCRTPGLIIRDNRARAIAAGSGMVLRPERSLSSAMGRPQPREHRAFLGRKRQRGGERKLPLRASAARVRHVGYPRNRLIG